MKYPDHTRKIFQDYPSYQPRNLNRLGIPTDGSSLENTADNSTAGFASTVYFRNLNQHLIEHIQQADLVIGCVAWMTNTSILTAMASVPHGVSIIVQKEDFLRPDLEAQQGWQWRLRQLYNSLPAPPERYTFHPLVGGLSYAGDPSIQPVRCVGNHNNTRTPAFPRMHNKFLVFCNVGKTTGDSYSTSPIQPHTVWTGSFNLTQTATESLENALVITDPPIVEAYYNEWQSILALSEPLDWTTEWAFPEWRLGS